LKLRAETFWDRLPTWQKWGRINQVVATGPFCRSTLCELISKGEIKSFVFKMKGARRGCRLINLEDLDRFIQAAAEKAEEAEVVK
jgi:hypothetical protein